MAFERVIARVPTTISELKIRLLFEINAVATEVLRTTSPVEQAVSLSIASVPKQTCELVSVVLSEIGGGVLVEDADYMVDYIEKTITPLASGSMVEDTEYSVEYVYDKKSSAFSMNVLDADGAIMRQYQGDLASHLTANQRDGIIQLLNDLRVKAENEVL
jgi:hypothetical protein